MSENQEEGLRGAYNVHEQSQQRNAVVLKRTCWGQVGD